jgi:M6 family metalloprotease-like protein
MAEHRISPARARRTTAYALHRIVSGALLTALMWTTFATNGSAMPPPALGNQKGLPESVKAQLREDPSLFYPRKGFKPVIERQRIQRMETESRLIRQGLSRQAARMQALAAIQTTRYAPVLCGLYADKGTPDFPVADLVDELFSLTYSQTNPFGHPGSMREHYRDMSYGTFDLQGGVFGWYTLPNNGVFYYGTDNGLGTTAADGETGAFIRHTLQASDPTTDFRLYDNDGPDNIPNSGDDDGVVDLVMFVHPNEGGECGGDDIWSHSFSYSGWAQHPTAFVTNDIGFNGQPIKIDDYVIMPAISCFGGRIEIGVFSHEFGHALGLPDLYDRTAYDPAGAVSTGGIGLFGLMAAGSYGGDYAHPATPTQMCAWSKEQLGWLQPKEIICDETLALYYQGDAPEAAKLWRGGDYSRNEWFLVENRQRKKWDKFLLSEGLFITHIDNNVLTQNDEACPGGNPCPTGHYLVMVIEADGQWEMQAAAPPLNGPWFGEAEDFFSAANNDTWADLTIPSTRDHTGMSTGVSVTNISASADKMFADFSVSEVCQSVPALAIVGSRIAGGCDLDPFLDAGERVSLNVTLRNFPTAAPANSIAGTLTSLTTGVTVPVNSANFPSLDRGKFGETIVPFEIEADATAACSTQAMLRLDLSAAGGYSVSETLTVRVGIDSLYVPFPVFLDDVEQAGENGWKHYAFQNSDDWSHNTNGNHTLGAVPGNSWFSTALPTGKDVSLEPPAFIPSATSVVTFWHKYDTEDDWDGCVFELSTDGGKTWIDVGDMTNVGYDDAVMVNPQSNISGRRSWNGLNASYPLFDEVTLDMSPWDGQTCILRFRMACDLASTGLVNPGWNIDDYQVTDAAILRERCEATPLCGGAETDAPVFAGLESAANPGAAACDQVDLKWQAATDASPPLTYLVYASTTSPVPATSPIASTTRLKHRVSGLTPGETYFFLVRARDSQGNIDGNSAEHSVTLTCDPPNLAIHSSTLTETIGCDGDDLPDAGETLNLAVEVRNVGSTNAKNVVATLTSLSPYVLVSSGTAAYGDLAAAHYEYGHAPFTIKVLSDAPCTTPATLQLEIEALGYTVTRTIQMTLESDVGFTPLQFLDDVESGPGGFTHMAESGSDDWGIVSTAAHSATQSWFASDAGVVTNKSLISPPLFISGSSVLTFWHRYVLESSFDGGVLEVSTDDGDTWTDIGQSYNSSQNPLGPAFGSPFAPGQAFWSGNSNGFVQETVNIGAMTSPLGDPLYAGQLVLIRWRMGCDDTNTSAPFEGWWIDDISLTDSGTFTSGCDGTTACETVAVDDLSLPRRTALDWARPNPMRSTATLDFQIAAEDAGRVALEIFDVAGRKVRTLVDESKQPGRYSVQWRRTDDAGIRVSGGVYFARLQAGGHGFTRKLVLVK